MSEALTKWIELNNQLTELDESGFYKLDKDKEAAHSYFVDFVNQNTVFFHSLEEKIDYLVGNDFYEKDFLNKYNFEDIKDVFKLAYSKKFRFPSYMGAFKFYNDYAMKTNDGKKFLERYEDRMSIMSLYLADGDVEKAKKFVDMFVDQRYVSATPTMLNVGKSRRGEMVSCFLLSCPDSLNGINFMKNSASQLSKLGGGISIDLTRVRAKGETIKGIEGAASGVIPLMKVLEDTASYINQLGQRSGAFAIYLNIFHADVEDVIDSKKINSDEKIRMKSLSIGLTVPDKFFELVREDKDMYLFYPKTIHEAYGIEMADMDLTEMYDELVNNPKVRKRKIVARDLMNEITKSYAESGYPYFMFYNNANKQNPLKGIGTIKMSNLCNEVFQIQEQSEIADYGEVDIIREDISCNLGSMNIVKVMESKKLEDTVSSAIDCLTFVSENTSIKNAPSIKKGNESYHSVGLGAMNLAGFLAKNKIPYESKTAREFVDVFFAATNFYSLKRSMEIARDRKETFKDFDKTDYASGVYFDKYINNEFLPVSEKVKGLFEGIELPTKENWKQLKEDVMEHGVFNSYRMAIAPTQSISYVASCTSGLSPIVDLIETRTYGNSTTYYQAPYLDKETELYYTSAYDVDMIKMIDLIATAQQHIDQGISTVIYVDSNKTNIDLMRYVYYACKKGLKGLYYVRTKKLKVEECVSCAI